MSTVNIIGNITPLSDFSSTNNYVLCVDSNGKVFYTSGKTYTSWSSHHDDTLLMKKGICVEGVTPTSNPYCLLGYDGSKIIKNNPVITENLDLNINNIFTYIKGVMVSYVPE